MIDYPVFISLWTIVILFVFLNRSSKVNAPEQVLVEQGDYVFYRDVPIVRIFKLTGKAILKTDVLQIEQTSTKLTLVTARQRYDIYVPKRLLSQLAQRAQQLFIDAEFSKK